jgi:hypothetical protein
MRLSPGHLNRRAIELRKTAAPAHRSANANVALAICKKLKASGAASRKGPKVLNKPASAPIPAPQAAACGTLQPRVPSLDG